VAQHLARRAYSSPLREESAQQTRRAIVAAAHELFARQGYVATSVEQIAARAGVSKPTVFASVGSKAEVLKVVKDVAIAGDDAPIALADRPSLQGVVAEPDPRRSLELMSHVHVAVCQRFGAIEACLQAAAGADPAVTELWQTNLDQRRQGAALIVRSLRTKGPLRAGLRVEEAVDLLWAHMSPAAMWQPLVVRQGWTPARYRRWWAQTVADHLLGPEA
jgi:AcrR family transcriptional regulator